MRIGYTDAVAEMLGSNRPVPEYGRLGHHQYEEEHALINEFLAEMFTATDPGRKLWRYRLSVAIAEKFLAAEMVEGLMYPTIAMFGNADNFALRPRFADTHLRPIYSEFLEITGVHGTQFSLTVLDEARAFGSAGQIDWIGHPAQWTIDTAGGQLLFEAVAGHWVARNERGEIVDPH